MVEKEEAFEVHEDHLAAARADFPGFEESWQLFFDTVNDHLFFYSHHLGEYEYLLSILSVICNSFHLFVLSHKDMRNTSTSVILIGIALSDLIYPLTALENKFEAMFDTGCWSPKSHFGKTVSLVLLTARDNFRRCSSLLGIMLAAVRTIFLMNSLNPKFSILIKASFGWKIIMCTLLFSSMISFLFFLRFESRVVYIWVPAPYCTEFPDGFSLPQYDYHETKLFSAHGGLVRNIYLFVEGAFSKIVPCLLFPIFTFLLIRELRKSRQLHSARSKPSDSNHTTKLITCMSTVYFLCEFPIGVAFWAQSYITTNGFMSITNHIILLFTLFYTFTSIFHFLICLAISAQYQKTVKTIFKRTRPKTGTPSVVTLA